MITAKEAKAKSDIIAPIKEKEREFINKQCNEKFIKEVEIKINNSINEGNRSVRVFFKEYLMPSSEYLQSIGYSITFGYRNDIDVEGGGYLDNILIEW